MADSGLIKKLWRWFDQYFLFASVAFLAVFIPLYPKIPIADILPGYIVRLRLEDIFIVVFGGWWLIQLARKKITWKTPLTVPILVYVAVGFLSVALGVVLSHTIPAQLLHIGKSALHWLRYIQYFLLFFLGYDAIKTRKQAIWLIGLSMATLIGVFIYGFGQKYLYWPVFSTMNREFSKGIRLYLGEFARVQSTFAGHYDLGAYLVILLPLAIALIYSWKSLMPPNMTKWQKRLSSFAWWALVFGWVSGLWLLALSASRISFGGYMAGAGLVILLFMLKRGLKWGITRGLVVLVVTIVIVIGFGELPSRFAQLVDDQQHPQVRQALDYMNDLRKYPGKLIGIQPAHPPGDGVAVQDQEQDLNAVGLTLSDTTPTTRPSDVQVNVPNQVLPLGTDTSTLSGTFHQEGNTLVQDRTYSQCSLQHSLSLCIRLETLWPWAIQGFLRDPLFGSGYATLNKTSEGEFTEAESTDNNFLRTLGETGALGFVFFYGSVGLAMWYEFQAYQKSKDPLQLALAVGLLAGSAGLLVNASYIDVFASSKVAYTFWMLQGVTLALLVKEGVIAPQFAFARQAEKKDVQTLSQLLQQVEAKNKERDEAPTATGYLSSQKRKQKSSRPKHGRRQ